MLAAMPPLRSALGTIVARAREPIDGASIAFFRIAFGLLLAERLWREVRTGVVHEIFIEPTMLFSYPGFEWVRPWEGLEVQVALTALAALGIALGALYRVSAVLFLIGFTYVFLLDQTQYLNHDYLIVLYALLLVFVPAHRQVSVDARLFPPAAPTVPRVALWVLRAQMGLVYFYAGVAKLNGDWLTGWPLRIWLGDRADVPLLGPLLALPATAIAMSLSGLLIDLAAAPLLCIRRTRAPMFLVLLAFHLINAQVFSIGVFPWLSIAATTLFFDPSWPRRVFRWRAPRPQGGQRVSVAWTALCGAYVAVQALLPLRHFAYPGDVSWTEEGHRFAWHMMLRHKEGEAEFVVRDAASGTTWSFDPGILLTEEQVEEMVGRPPLIHATARAIARRERERLGIDVEVRARVRVSLNGHPPRLLVDPTVDLAREPVRVFAPDPWIRR